MGGRREGDKCKKGIKARKDIMDLFDEPYDGKYKLLLLLLL
jgi:hypothetical protein